MVIKVPITVIAVEVLGHLVVTETILIRESFGTIVIFIVGFTPVVKSIHVLIHGTFALEVTVARVALKRWGFMASRRNMLFTGVPASGKLAPTCAARKCHVIDIKWLEKWSE